MNKLPKVDYLISTIELPVSKAKVPFRPFRGKEEKILLTAKESNSKKDILTSIKQVIQNSALDDKFDVNKIPIIDLEYLFVKLRALSIDNVIRQAFRDNGDGRIYEFDVKLDDVKVVTPESYENTRTIKISDDMMLELQSISAKYYDEPQVIEAGEADLMFFMMSKCLKTLYHGDTMYRFSDYTDKEIEEFLDDLPLKPREDIKEFLTNQPSLEYVINYTNSEGEVRKIVLSSLTDFFQFA